jgi:hypothetical protein
LKLQLQIALMQKVQLARVVINDLAGCASVCCASCRLANGVGKHDAWKVSHGDRVQIVAATRTENKLRIGFEVDNRLLLNDASAQLRPIFDRKKTCSIKGRQRKHRRPAAYRKVSANYT